MTLILGVGSSPNNCAAVRLEVVLLLFGFFIGASAGAVVKSDFLALVVDDCASSFGGFGGSGFRSRCGPFSGSAARALSVRFVFPPVVGPPFAAVVVLVSVGMSLYSTHHSTSIFGAFASS